MAPLLIDRLNEAGVATRLRRIDQADRPDEAWLQRLIHAFPQTLPIRAIEILRRRDDGSAEVDDDVLKLREATEGARE